MRFFFSINLSVSAESACLWHSLPHRDCHSHCQHWSLKEWESSSLWPEPLPNHHQWNRWSGHLYPGCGCHWCWWGKFDWLLVVPKLKIDRFFCYEIILYRIFVDCQMLVSLKSRLYFCLHYRTEWCTVQMETTLPCFTSTSQWTLDLSVSDSLSMELHKPNTG